MGFGRRRICGQILLRTFYGWDNSRVVFKNRFITIIHLFRVFFIIFLGYWQNVNLLQKLYLDTILAPQFPSLRNIPSKTWPQATLPCQVHTITVYDVQFTWCIFSELDDNEFIEVELKSFNRNLKFRKSTLVNFTGYFWLTNNLT